MTVPSHAKRGEVLGKIASKREVVCEAAENVAEKWNKSDLKIKNKTRGSSENKSVKARECQDDVNAGKNRKCSQIFGDFGENSKDREIIENNRKMFGKIMRSSEK